MILIPAKRPEPDGYASPGPRRMSGKMRQANCHDNPDGVLHNEAYVQLMSLCHLHVGILLPEQSLTHEEMMDWSGTAGNFTKLGRELKANKEAGAYGPLRMAMAWIEAGGVGPRLHERSNGTDANGIALSSDYPDAVR